MQFFRRQAGCTLLPKIHQFTSFHKPSPYSIPISLPVPPALSSSRQYSRQTRLPPQTTSRRHKGNNKELQELSEDGEQPISRRPEHNEFGQHRHASRGALRPEDEAFFKFRRGMNVPRWNPDNWMIKLIVEPWIALRGHTIVYFDSHIRVTRRGFYILHSISFLLAIGVAYKSPDFVYADVQDKMVVSQHLYMIDVAKLLWLQQALKNCEAVINQRVDGIPPGLTLPEALRTERESPFVSPEYRREHDIVLRAQKLSAAQEKQQQMDEFRKEMWGNLSPSQILAKREHLTRIEEVQREKAYVIENRLAQSQGELKFNMDQNKSNFRSKYIQPHIKPPQ